jgi:hypothetical protein
MILNANLVQVPQGQGSPAIQLDYIQRRRIGYRIRKRISFPGDFIFCTIY